jgi:NAD(P)-dependent dehydrogenase (short-subunit alcohol dehydrogenase family)
VFDLSGRTALVTGAGRGVGAGIAAALAGQGAHVVVNDLDAQRAEEAAHGLRPRAAAGTTACPFDVTDHSAVVEAVAALPPIDILVNNAGIVDGMDVVQFRETSPGDWEDQIRLNVQGVMNCCHAVLGAMCERGWGRIITISSGAGTTGTRLGVSPYAAGKGGGIAFTRTLAMEVAREGVTANSLALGILSTGDAALDADLSRTVPVGRTGAPAEVGAAVVWLASEEAAWVTGQTIGVNGGAVTS